MISGFGFAHMHVRNIHDTCTCDEGLAALFKDKERRQNSQAEEELKKRYAYESGSEPSVIFDNLKDMGSFMSDEEMREHMKDILGNDAPRSRRRKSGL
jgi:hypothetical protein